MRNLVLVSLLLFAVSLPAAAQSARHPFTYDDMATLRHAQAMAVSPDGKTVLYLVTYGGAKGPDNHDWYLIPVSGGDARQLSLPKDFKPVGFTPDGKGFYGTMRMDKVATAGHPAAGGAEHSRCNRRHADATHVAASRHPFRAALSRRPSLRAAG